MNQSEPSTGSTSNPTRRIHPQHTLTTLLSLTLLKPTTPLPLSNRLSGGYLTSPPARNYLAYTLGSTLPSASRPLSSLPEVEPTPHSLKSTSGEGTCGTSDSVRDYDLPKSRMQTLLPLNIQSSFSAGSEIEVSVSLYGLDMGGHFEFSLCPVIYPMVPTKECFDAHPLEFVRDVNYGAVRDEAFPERAYLPLAGAFEEMNVVVDGRDNPAGVEMMEFKYVLKLPGDADLITYESDMVANSQSVDDSGQDSSFAEMVANSQGLGDESDGPSLAQQFTQGAAAIKPGNRFRLRRLRNLQSLTTPITSIDEKERIQNLTALANSIGPISESGQQQWYATQVDNGYTISNVATVPISSIVTDGNGTTIITTLEGVTVLTGGAKVPASMTTTWGDALIYGEGIELPEVDPVTTEAPVTTTVETTETTSQVTTETPTTTTTTTTTTSKESNTDSPVNSIKPNTPQEPQTVSASIPPKPTTNNTKYVLLRWHYVTSLNCHPVGYDTYPWPAQWGNWSAPWAGECTSNSSQDHYWNCAEVQIVGVTNESNENDMVAVSESIPKPTIIETESSENKPPQAMPDMILVGMNELAHLNVLGNDVDPNGDELFLEEVTEAQVGYVALLDGKKELIYAPEQDFVGDDFFEYTVCDAHGQCDTARIDVVVGSNSDLVFAKDDRANTTGTNSIKVDVVANDILQRADQPVVRSSDPLIVTQVSGTRRGECKVTNDNQVRYTASESFIQSQGYPAQDRCRYTVCLGENSQVCDEGWLSIKIFEPETLPEDTDGNLTEESDGDSTEEGASFELSEEDTEDVDINSSSPEDTQVDSSQETNEESDSDSLEVDTADSLHSEFDAGDMQVLTSNIGSDGSGDVIAIDDDVVIDSHDEPIKINVLENDEYTGTPYLSEVKDATSGKCSRTEDNQVLYTPTPGFVGWDRCQYTVCVEDDVCDEGRVKVRVMILPQDTNFSSNIVTATDKVMAQTGKPVVVDVTTNDVVLGSNRPLVVTDASPALHGRCTVTESNKVEYVSNEGFTGWDRCQYTVCMGKTCNVGQIGIKVTSTSTSVSEITFNAGEITDSSTSIAKADAVTVVEGTTAYLDVLANDIKPDGYGLAIESVTNPSSGHAQIVFGRVEYTPDDGFVGLDSFEYTVCAEPGHCDNANVAVTVVSDASSSEKDNTVNMVSAESSMEVFAEDDEATVVESESVIVDVMANDSISPDGSNLVLSSVSKAIRGTCVITPANKIKYTAPEGFVGLDRCSYTVCVDDVCDEGRIELTISSATTESTFGGISIVPSEKEKPSLAEQVASTPSDEKKPSSFGAISIMPPDDQPQAVDVKRIYADDDSVVTSKNVPILVDVTINDIFNGSTDLAITHAGGSQHGDCVIEELQIRYTPHDDFTGQDRCGYIVCEGSNCDEGIIRIKVVSETSALKHDKSSMVRVGSIGNTRSSSVQLCSQAALNHDLRRLRGGPLKRIPSVEGKNRQLEANISSSCVGPSLVTTVTTSTQTITYTSTYHKENTGSLSRARSVNLHSKIRSASAKTTQSYVDTEISLATLADATVMPGFPDQNFGTAQSMLVSSASSKSGRHDAFLKFDTSSVDASVCSDGIIDAKITIYSLSRSAQGGTFLTTPNSMSWTEGDVTWNNAPNSNGIVLDSLGQVEAKTYYDIDVSTALVLGEPLNIHILAGASSNMSAQYATKDHSDSLLHPSLRITCIAYDGPDLDE